MFRIVLAGMSPRVSQDEENVSAGYLMSRFPSYGVRRIHAALDVASDLPELEIITFDVRDVSAETLAEHVLAREPDVVGLSLYVWSMRTLCETARLIRNERPECLIVAGGPSARPMVLDLPPFASFHGVIDALVTGEGEEVMREIVRARISGVGLTDITGLAIPTASGWHRTREPLRESELDRIASPFQQGLMPAEHVAYLETFRGCPLSCAFCQWGAVETGRHFSHDYLVRELTAIRETRPMSVFLVDAALNLNARAFRNLASAEAEVGLFRSTSLYCEVYPSFLRDEHLEFLANAGSVQIGLGLQSLDTGALQANERPFHRERLRPVIEQLSRHCRVDIELILGLPGDTPRSFRQTLDEVVQLGCSVRIYRCLVLPDALMSRAPASFDIRFDPETLFMTSCHTWSERELEETSEYVTRVAQCTAGGYAGSFWWHLLSSAPQYQAAYDRVAGERGVGTSVNRPAAS